MFLFLGSMFFKDIFEYFLGECIICWIRLFKFSLRSCLKAFLSRFFMSLWTISFGTAFGKVVFMDGNAVLWKSEILVKMPMVFWKLIGLFVIGLNGYRRFLIQLGSTDDGWKSSMTISLYFATPSNDIMSLQITSMSYFLITGRQQFHWNILSNKIQILDIRN